jgi:hypothetical protein
MRRSLTFLVVIAVSLLLFETNTRARFVFMDRFEYAVGRSDPNAAQLFIQNGWSHAKTQQSANARGYLHTVTSIPGFSGTFPGTDSSRVLAIEAKPGTLGGQTDFYLQLGTENTPEMIPGNVWFQFWVYPQNYGSQTSLHGTRNKFLYVTNDMYPSHSHKWMIEEKCNSGAPTYDQPDGCPSIRPWLTLRQTDGVSTISYTGPGSDDPDYRGDELGMQNTAESLVPNRWTLVKMHFDTSTTSGRWRVWLKRQGGQFVQVANWQNGVGGLVWTIPSAQVGGHRMLRMPTTVGGTDSQWHDYWIYMDDFVMATTEGELPVYAGGSGQTTVPPPQPPTNPRIIRSSLLDGSLFRSPTTFLQQRGLLP